MVVEDVVVGFVSGALGVFGAMKFLSTRVQKIELALPTLVSKDHCILAHSNLDKAVDKLTEAISDKGGLIDSIGRLDERIRSLKERLDKDDAVGHAID